MAQSVRHPNPGSWDLAPREALCSMESLLLPLTPTCTLSFSHINTILKRKENLHAVI